MHDTCVTEGQSAVISATLALVFQEWKLRGVHWTMVFFFVVHA